MILKINDEGVHNIMSAKNMTLQRRHKSDGPVRYHWYKQQCVDKNNRTTKLNNKNRTTNKKNILVCLGVTDINNIIGNQRPEFMTRLKTLASGAA